MEYLDESHILLFLVQILLLLGLARGLGLLFQRYGQPAVTAEIITGVILGPTILGRLFPALQSAIFPDDAIQRTMLDSVAWLGVLLFLLTTGLETEFTNAWRQRREAFTISMSDLILPMVVAFVPSLFMPASLLANPDARILFALFIATIMTISALPVTARALQDLGIHRTDMGLLILAALTINDVAGWVVFALILGFVTHGALDVGTAGFILVGTAVFAVGALTVGRWAVDRAIAWIQKARLPEPGASLTLITLVGLFFGTITTWLGVHALFGFFTAGVVAGESRSLPQRTRQTMDQMVRSILVPVFFATIGLRIDFAARFNLLFVVFIIVIGIAGRFIGAWVGASLTKQPRANRLLIAVAHTPGGEMQIVIGILALSYAVITETVFVAVVFGAVASSIALGPWMKHALGIVRRGSVLQFLSQTAVAADIHVESKDEAIRFLSHIAARQRRMGDSDTIATAVLERESARSTALAQGVAVPHARLPESRGLVVVGTARDGIDWDAPDGIPARIIFLIITPVGSDDQQILILRAIASAMVRAENRSALIDADTDTELWTAVQKVFAAEAVTQAR